MGAGEFAYEIAYENYFDPSKEEPRSNILIINDKKFVIQFGRNHLNGAFLQLINYSDGKIYYHLDKI